VRSARRDPAGLTKETPVTVSRRVAFLLLVIYLAIGIYVAWIHGYLTATLLKHIAEALLAIFLWFLVLLGVDLHIGR